MRNVPLVIHYILMILNFIIFVRVIGSYITSGWNDPPN